MYINNVLYCFYSSDIEALEACFRLLHDDDDDAIEYRKICYTVHMKRSCSVQHEPGLLKLYWPSMNTLYIFNT